MVGRWGMSAAIGPIAVLPRDGRPCFGAPESRRGRRGSSTTRCAASWTSSHAEVLTLLQENRSKLDALAGALLEHETLDEDDAYAAAGVTRSAEPVLAT